MTTLRPPFRHRPRVVVPHGSAWIPSPDGAGFIADAIGPNLARLRGCGLAALVDFPPDPPAPQEALRVAIAWRGGRWSRLVEIAAEAAARDGLRGVSLVASGRPSSAMLAAAVVALRATPLRYWSGIPSALCDGGHAHLLDVREDDQLVTICGQPAGGPGWHVASASSAIGFGSADTAERCAHCARIGIDRKLSQLPLVWW